MYIVGAHVCPGHPADQSRPRPSWSTSRINERRTGPVRLNTVIARRCRRADPLAVARRPSPDVPPVAAACWHGANWHGAATCQSLHNAVRRRGGARRPPHTAWIRYVVHDVTHSDRYISNTAQLSVHMEIQRLLSVHRLHSAVIGKYATQCSYRYIQQHSAVIGIYGNSAQRYRNTVRRSGTDVGQDTAEQNYNRRESSVVVKVHEVQRSSTATHSSSPRGSTSTRHSRTNHETPPVPGGQIMGLHRYSKDASRDCTGTLMTRRQASPVHGTRRLVTRLHRYLGTITRLNQYTVRGAAPRSTPRWAQRGR